MKIERFEAAGLKCIEVAPDNASPDLPLIVTMHGLGDRGESYVDIAPAISSTAYRFVFPTAPTPIYANGFQWFAFEPRNLITSVLAARQQITNLLQALSERYALPTNRIVLSGFSQGAMMTLDVGLRYRGKDGQRLAGLAAFSGMLLIESSAMLNFMSGDFNSVYANVIGDTESVLKAAAVDKLPVLVVHGRADGVVPVAADRASVGLLKKHGVPVEYVEFNYGHEISLETLNVINQFLAKLFR